MSEARLTKALQAGRGYWVLTDIAVVLSNQLEKNCNESFPAGLIATILGLPNSTAGWNHSPRVRCVGLRLPTAVRMRFSESSTPGFSTRPRQWNAFPHCQSWIPPARGRFHQFLTKRVKIAVLVALSHLMKATASKRIQPVSYGLNQRFTVIGMTRFELATSAPPVQRSNQAEPHPA